jgi:hypothetical protein
LTCSVPLLLPPLFPFPFPFPSLARAHAHARVHVHARGGDGDGGGDGGGGGGGRGAVPPRGSGRAYYHAYPDLGNHLLVPVPVPIHVPVPVLGHGRFLPVPIPVPVLVLVPGSAARANVRWPWYSPCCSAVPCLLPHATEVQNSPAQSRSACVSLPAVPPAVPRTCAFVPRLFPHTHTPNPMYAVTHT